MDVGAIHRPELSLAPSAPQRVRGESRRSGALEDHVTACVAKPASQSRTLRFNRLVTWVAGIFFALPDLVAAALLQLLFDPDISTTVANIIPMKYRALIFVVVAAVAQRNRRLRYETSQPIVKEVPAGSSES